MGVYVDISCLLTSSRGNDFLGVPSLVRVTAYIEDEKNPH